MKTGMRKSATNGRSKNLMQTYVSSIISLVLCCAMLLGTTMAWFTATVESKGHEIYIGVLDIDLLNGTTSLKDHPDTDLFDDVPRWEPNATAVEQLTVVDEGDLAFNYKLTFASTNSAIVNTAATDQFEVWVHPGAWTVTGNDYEKFTATGSKWTKVGSLTEVLAGKTVFSGTMDIEEDHVDTLDPTHTYTVALHMKKTATGEGIMGKTVKIDVKLEATQLTSETDTFGDDYDENAGFSGAPVAFVVELEDKTVPYTWGIGGAAESAPLKMDTAYKFKPTDTYNEVQTSPYRYWHADYVVSADKDVLANSIALAGFYHTWCDVLNNGNWVAIPATEDVTAGTEIRLVQLLGNGSITVNYEEICRYAEPSTELPEGDSFKCGAVDLTGENAGTTMTVELRLYETTADPNSTSGDKNIETGEYITIGKFTYTFPEVPVAPADFQTAMNNAQPGDTIYLAAGDYALNTSMDGYDGITIIGAAGTKLTLNDSWSGSYVTPFKGNNVTIKNVTFENALTASGSFTFENCTFEDTLREAQYTGATTFTGCTFNVKTASFSNIPFHFIKNTTSLTVENCTINGNTDFTNGGESGTVLFKGCTITGDVTPYSTNVTLTGCTVGGSIDDSHSSTVTIN